MKNFYQNLILNFLLVTPIVLSSSFVAAESDTNLITEYQRVAHSYRGGEMIFSCGSAPTVFKITSSIFSKPALYWKSGVDWNDLKDVDFKDAGIIFRGLGREGGIPIQHLKFNVDLPMFNKDILSNDISPQSYFIKSKKGEFVPYEYTVDMFEENMVSINLHPVVDYLELDSKKYKREQSTIQDYMLRSEQQRVRERQDRFKAISSAIESYDEGIEVTTPARSFESEENCYLYKQ